MSAHYIARGGGGGGRGVKNALSERNSKKSNKIKINQE